MSENFFLKFKMFLMRKNWGWGLFKIKGRGWRWLKLKLTWVINREMPNSPQAGFILGDPRAAGRDYQFYTGEVYKIWYRPWKSDSPHKLALGQRGWVSLGCLIPRLSQGWAVTREFESGVLDTSVVWWNLTQISWVEEVFPRVLRDSSGADTSSA